MGMILYFQWHVFVHRKYFSVPSHEMFDHLYHVTHTFLWKYFDIYVNEMDIWWGGAGWGVGGPLRGIHPTQLLKFKILAWNQIRWKSTQVCDTPCVHCPTLLFYSFLRQPILQESVELESLRCPGWGNKSVKFGQNLSKANPKRPGKSKCKTNDKIQSFNEKEDIRLRVHLTPKGITLVLTRDFLSASIRHVYLVPALLEFDINFVRWIEQGLEAFFLHRFKCYLWKY